MKIDRFIKEYASYKRKRVNNRHFTTDEQTLNDLAKIDKIIVYVSSGLITIDEAMLKLSEI